MTSGRNHNQRSVDSCTSCLLRRTWNSNARAERNIFRVRLPYMNRVTDRAPLVSPSSARSRHPICLNVWIVPAGRSCWYAPNILYEYSSLDSYSYFQERLDCPSRPQLLVRTKHSCTCTRPWTRTRTPGENIKLAP